MPVLSEPPSLLRLPGIKSSSILLGIFLVISLALYVVRKCSSPNYASVLPMKSPEKDPTEFLPAQSASPVSFTEPYIPSSQQASSPTPGAPFEFDSFQPAMAMGLPPRRRSYTKMITSGGEEVLVEGEIVVAEGWRRHTRVFGGGVCIACEESERKMSA